MEKGTKLRILRKENLTFELTKVKSIKFEIPSLNKFKLYNENELPEQNMGLYALIKEDFIFYIGATTNIKNRLKKHKINFIFNKYLFYPFHNKTWLYLYEKILIIKYKPIANNTEEYKQIRPSVLNSVYGEDDGVIVK